MLIVFNAEDNGDVVFLECGGLVALLCCWWCRSSRVLLLLLMVLVG
jgi:hypothetical protein